MQERIIWIDNLKVIGILAVILGHIASPLGYIIYSWHMPLFFFLAGIFIKHELSTKEFITNDYNRLIIPYFIFSAIALIVETAKRVALNRDGLNYFHELEGIFLWMDHESLINTYGFVLWFLPALFFGRLFIFLLDKKIEYKLIQFIIILLLFYVSFNINLILGLDNALNILIYIFLGSLYYRFYQNDKRLFALAFIFLGLIFYYGIPSLDIASKSYENVFINVLFSLCVIFIFVSILRKINYKSKFLNLWGANTMLLFIIHPYTNNIAHVIVNKINFGDWYLKFFISLILLQAALLIKKRFENIGIFKYV